MHLGEDEKNAESLLHLILEVTLNDFGAYLLLTRRDFSAKIHSVYL